MKLPEVSGLAGRLAGLTLALALVGCGSSGGSVTGEEGHATTAGTSAPSPSASALEDSEANGAPADATRLEDGATIAMVGFAFSEEVVVVPVGATLTFVNEDSVGHTVTEGEQGFATDGARFDRPVLAGGSVEISFDDAGRYDITCLPHPIMQMTVYAEA